MKGNFEISNNNALCCSLLTRESSSKAGKLSAGARISKGPEILVMHKYVERYLGCMDPKSFGLALFELRICSNQSNFWS